MGDAYTPGLTVTARTVVRKMRRLPLPGTVLAKVGDRVTADRVIARTDLPGRVHLLNFANVLGCLADELAGKLTVEVGASIRKGQILAESRTFFGLFTSRVESPIEGTLESVSAITGQAVMREPPTPVEVLAYLDGVVVEEIADEGVVIESDAAMVQGIFGLAGEVRAPIAVIVSAPDEILDEDSITAEHAGKIVVGGAQVTLAGMRKAIEVGCAAVVVGGFAYHDIKELLGFDIGVAVTGSEDLGTTLVVTEGFGCIAMARATFELLGRFEGRDASVTGATQIRAGVIRPEVVICHRPDDDAHAADDAVVGAGLAVGAPVRCIRAPYFGEIGKVTDLPVELQQMESETMVRVLEVELETSGRVILPRANVEVIEG